MCVQTDDDLLSYSISRVFQPVYVEVYFATSTVRPTIILLRVSHVQSQLERSLFKDSFAVSVTELFLFAVEFSDQGVRRFSGQVDPTYYPQLLITDVLLGKLCSVYFIPHPPRPPPPPVSLCFVLRRTRNWPAVGLDPSVSAFEVVSTSHACCPCRRRSK